jgi:hypothetical protein
MNTNKHECKTTQNFDFVNAGRIVTASGLLEKTLRAGMPAGSGPLKNISHE